MGGKPGAMPQAIMVMGRWPGDDSAQAEMAMGRWPGGIRAPTARRDNSLGQRPGKNVRKFSLGLKARSMMASANHRARQYPERRNFTV